MPEATVEELLSCILSVDYKAVVKVLLDIKDKLKDVDKDLKDIEKVLKAILDKP